MLHQRALQGLEKSRSAQTLRAAQLYLQHSVFRAAGPDVNVVNGLAGGLGTGEAQGSRHIAWTGQALDLPQDGLGCFCGLGVICSRRFGKMDFNLAGVIAGENTNADMGINQINPAMVSARLVSATFHRCRVSQRTQDEYFSRTTSNEEWLAAKTPGWRPTPIHTAKIGTKVLEAKYEAIMANPIARDNGIKSARVAPCMKNEGTNTASRHSMATRRGRLTSHAPSRTASVRAFPEA